MKVLFRAKTIRQDFKDEAEYLKCMDGAWYAIGSELPFTSGVENGVTISMIMSKDGKLNLCDYSTRAIHFEDMLDIENNPIFASLSPDGEGGDKLECVTRYQNIKKVFTCIYQDKGSLFPFVHFENLENKTYKDDYCIFKVIGIKQ